MSLIMEVHIAGCLPIGSLHSQLVRHYNCRRRPIRFFPGCRRGSHPDTGHGISSDCQSHSGLGPFFDERSPLHVISTLFLLVNPFPLQIIQSFGSCESSFAESADFVRYDLGITDPYYAVLALKKRACLNHESGCSRISLLDVFMGMPS